MTGLENLKQEMLKRGCTKQQCESKLIHIVLDILSNSNGEYIRVQEEKAITEQRIDELRIKKSSFDSYYKEKIQYIDKREKELITQRECLADQLMNVANLLNDLETPEMRDRLLMAQAFINNVDVQTPQNNTAFILALGSIMAGEKYIPIDKLQKMSLKIPDWRGEEF